VNRLQPNAPCVGLPNGKGSSMSQAGSGGRKNPDGIRMVFKKMKEFKKNNEQPGH
jgi:hypothetical protein